MLSCLVCFKSCYVSFMGLFLGLFFFLTFLCHFVKLFRSSWYLILLRSFLNCLNFLLVAYWRKIWMNVFISVNTEGNFLWFGQCSALRAVFRSGSQVQIYHFITFSKTYSCQWLNWRSGLTAWLWKSHITCFKKKSNQSNFKKSSIRVEGFFLSV